ncbi:uncharacterized protein Z518_03627 [Rhinocladiella mackenziei CBS 650.93]|uniref:ABC transporter domain-containing protein n=1 Tax=Rhinocladiella mackenziei CBS 650.93 TaxID=1442369 RepID=A0A0D2J959_9EURO|nr:uncharacterized protein Z518_03627 [Rhinocladiella mackenziei CBS 650.93]KIX05655.1 hypothetical protein Z518_03627 [Rhinocladiella mackenziei CBS 650.93]
MAFSGGFVGSYDRTARLMNTASPIPDRRFSESLGDKIFHRRSMAADERQEDEIADWSTHWQHRSSPSISIASGNQNQARIDVNIGDGSEMAPSEQYGGVRELARQWTRQSRVTEAQGNPLPRAWTKAVLQLAKDDNEHFKTQKAGVCFKNLSVHGYGTDSDYQMTVGTLLWQALDISKRYLGHKGRRVDILRNFDGAIHPGEMLVVLGPPGSGCSTFLKTLAGETHGFVVDRDSHVNYQGIGYKQMKKNFRGESIYTAEHDTHFPYLSVGDTLYFAARARAPRFLPEGCTKHQYAEMMRNVIMATFGIRREGSITEVNDVAVAVAIYQAPQTAYEVFDKVILLYDGRQNFFGSTKKAKDYFINLGFKCSDRQTDADFLTSMTSPVERIVRPGYEQKVPRTPDEFAERWRQSPEYEALRKEIAKFEEDHPIGGPDVQEFVDSRRMRQSKNTRPGSPYTLSYVQQIKLCLWRAFVQLKADPGITLTQLIGNFGMSLIISSVFYNLDTTAGSFYSRGALLFFAIMMSAFGSALEILSRYAQRPIVEKHVRYALYHSSAEAFASMICDLPYKITNAILFNVTIYFMTNLRREPAAFFFFLLFSFIMTLTMSMMFRGIASISRTLEQAMAPAGWARWINYLNPVAYGFESLMINEFSGRTYSCTGGLLVPNYPNAKLANQICSAVGSQPAQTFVTGDVYLDSAYGYKASHRWRNLGILMAFLIAFMVAHLAATEYIWAKKSKGEVLVFQRGRIPRSLQSSSADDIEKVRNGEMAAPSQWNGMDVSEVVQKQTAIFQWKDVCYDIKIKGQPRRILDHVDGWVKPGTLTALVGVSGAGKTTLLDVLAKRVTMGVISGEMLVDGCPRDSSFQRKTGYVQQQDLHLQTSTVREALIFSAVLRQPARVPRKEKVAYVDEVIKLLDMQEYADAVVGVLGEGLNVEQRKRLTIGVELTAKPQLLLFLDEPTSGLDSQTSWSILNLLDKLTKNGQAILCTIHQPSAMLFQRFDRLLFLADGGKTVYFGPVGQSSRTLISYFEKNGAPPCPPGANPAEWMLEVIGAAPGSHSDIDWPVVWRQSREVQHELSTMKHERSRLASVVDQTHDKSSYREFAVPFWIQWIQVQKRVFEQHWRTPGYIYAKSFMSDNTQQGLQNQMIGIFMLLSIFGQLVQQLLPLFVTQRALYEVRERPSKAYSWQAFVASNIIADIPWSLISAALLYFCWYYPIGLWRNAEPTDRVHERGALMFLLIVAFLLFTNTFAHMCIAAIETAETGANIANIMFSLCLIFCGVLISPTALPGFWIFMYRVPPFTYLIQAMTATAVGDTSVTCAKNEYLTLHPPSEQTCGEYMGPYVSTYGDCLTDPSAKANCSYCRLSETNAFLASVGTSPSDSWRNFGLLWVYIIESVDDGQPFISLNDDEFLGYFLIPTQDVLNFPDCRSRNRTNPFRWVFGYLHRVLEVADDPPVPIGLIESLLEVLLSFSPRRTRLVTKRAEPLKIRGRRIKCDGLFMQDQWTLVPVATFLVSKGSDDDKIREVQQILTQAILAFTQQPKMDEFISFVVCSTGAALYLAGAHITRGYIESLRKDQRPSLRLQVCRSAIYDLKIPDGRKDVAMLLLRMLKYLDERKLP